MTSISDLETFLYRLSRDVYSPLLPRLIAIESLDVEKTLTTFSHRIERIAPSIRVAMRILAASNRIPTARIIHALDCYKSARLVLQEIIHKIEQLRMDIAWVKSTTANLDPVVTPELAPLITKHVGALRLDAHEPLSSIRDNISLCTKVIAAFYTTRSGKAAPFSQGLRIRMLLGAEKLTECVNKTRSLLETPIERLTRIHKVLQKLFKVAGTAIGSTEGTTSGHLLKPTGTAPLSAATEHRGATIPRHIISYTAADLSTSVWHAPASTARSSPLEEPGAAAAAAAASRDLGYRSTLEPPLSPINPLLLAETSGGVREAMGGAGAPSRPQERAALTPSDEVIDSELVLPTPPSKPSMTATLSTLPLKEIRTIMAAAGGAGRAEELASHPPAATSRARPSCIRTHRGLPPGGIPRLVVSPFEDDSWEVLSWEEETARLEALAKKAFAAFTKESTPKR